MMTKWALFFILTLGFIWLMFRSIRWDLDHPCLKYEEKQVWVSDPTLYIDSNGLSLMGGVPITPPPHYEKREVCVLRVGEEAGK